MDGLKLERRIILCDGEANDCAVYRHVRDLMCSDKWATLEVLAEYLRADFQKWPKFFSLDALEECCAFLEFEEPCCNQADFIQKLISRITMTEVDDRRRHLRRKVDLV